MFVMFTDAETNGTPVVINLSRIASVHTMGSYCTIFIEGQNRPINVKEKLDDLKRILEVRTVAQLTSSSKDKSPRVKASQY